MADINSDFAQRVVVHSAQIPWIASPIVGVDRRMLDRIGDEAAQPRSSVTLQKAVSLPTSMVQAKSF
jgi:anti-sigma factor ChrR (cupin superfamily)